MGSVAQPPSDSTNPVKTPKKSKKTPTSPVPTSAPDPKSNLIAMPPTLNSALAALNKEICFVRDTNEIAELHADNGSHKLRYMSPYNFRTAAYSDRFLNADGRRIDIAAAWMKWDGRRKVNRTVYEPGQPRITPDGNLNTWFSSPNKPKKGDLTLWNRYLDHIFQSDPTYRDWVIAWLAYPIQHPGAKLNTALAFWSTQTGTGKTTLAYIMKEIYGQHNCSVLRDGDLDSAFNGWAINKQFIEVDELRSGPRARQRAETLKSLITQQRIPVDLKYQNRYEIRDTLNYYFTSNHITSLYLDKHDRRFFIHDVGGTKLPEEFYRKELGPWLKVGGFSAIHHYLLHEVDLARPIVGGDPYTLNPAPFSPNADAPHSKSRVRVVEASRDEVEAFLAELIDSPSNILGPDDHRTLFTATELHDIFRQSCGETKIGSQVIARKLTEQGLQVLDGLQIRYKGMKLRLYSIGKLPLTTSEAKAILIQERGSDETEPETEVEAYESD